MWLLVGAAAFIFLFLILREVFSGNWMMTPVIIRIGIFEIRWYGLLIASGILTCYFIGRHQALKEGFKDDHLTEALLLGVVFGIIGARLWYVFSEWSDFSARPSEILMTWGGGLAIHGGIVGVLLSTFLYTRLRKKVSFGLLQGYDIAAFVFPLGQAIGRWGNFFNYESYGRPTELPWKMYIPFPYRMPGYEQSEFFHPTFLYESVWNFILFAFLFFYIRRWRKAKGEVLALYLILYSVGRFWIESLRLDSLYWADHRSAQVTSIIMALSGIFIFFIARRRFAKEALKKR